MVVKHCDFIVLVLDNLYFNKYFWVLFQDMFKFLWNNLLLISDVVIFYALFSCQTLKALAFLDSSLSLLNSGRPHSSAPWSPLPTLLLGNLIQSALWVKVKVHFIYFPSVREQCPLMPAAQCLETMFHGILLLFLFCLFYSVRSMNPVFLSLFLYLDSIKLI